MLILVARTVILYATVMVSMRLLGKRQLGELEASELVVAVMISDVAVQPLLDTENSILYGLVPVATLVACEVLVSFALLKSLRLRAFLCGTPSMVIRAGVIDQREMRRCRFSVDELTVELRRAGVTDIAQVRYAVLETDGTLSVIRTQESAPATAGQLGVAGEDPGYPSIVINDGQLLCSNMRLVGVDEPWIMKEIQKRGGKSPADVYLMSVDTAGHVFYAPRTDQ